MDFEKYALLRDAIQILETTESDVLGNAYTKEAGEIFAVLEDSQSPITRKYQEKLYKAVINKAHIDFGDIPQSNGNIRNYTGYNTMVDTISTIKKLAEEQKAAEALEFTNIVETAIHNLESLSSTYEKAFTTKSERPALEYNSLVYFCVEATTALLYSFVDVVKDPTKDSLAIKIKNTSIRADEFFFQQLVKFNKIQDKMGIDYRKMLEAECSKDTKNFEGGYMAIGVGALTAIALAIVPLTREIVYQIYSLRSKLSEFLTVQANFLELNKTCVENNELFTPEKKQKVIKKQSDLAKKFRSLSDKLRVKIKKSVMDSKREQKKENQGLSIQSLKDEIDNSPFELFS